MEDNKTKKYTRITKTILGGHDDQILCGEDAFLKHAWIFRAVKIKSQGWHMASESILGNWNMFFVLIWLVIMLVVYTLIFEARKLYILQYVS